MNSAVRVKDTSPDALRHVFANLRECDRAELDATNYSLDPDEQTERLMGLATFQFAAYVGETPAAIIGAWPRWPGVWGAYAFGTDEFPGRSLTKFAHRVMVPALLEAGAHRAECASLWSHWRSHQWLERLGAKREAILRGYGKNRETFYLYALHLDNRTCAKTPPTIRARAASTSRTDERPSERALPRTGDRGGSREAPSS